MIGLNEYMIAQNSPLGALALWRFWLSFYENSREEVGPLLPHLMIILPIVFNKKIASSLHKKTKKIGLYRAISDDKTIPVGLQERMYSMEGQTFQAINVAFASNLLTYDKCSSQIIPKRKSIPFKLQNEDLKQIIQTSDRLGYWFSYISIEQIGIILKIRW